MLHIRLLMNILWNLKCFVVELTCINTYLIDCIVYSLFYAYRPKKLGILYPIHIKAETRLTLPYLSSLVFAVLLKCCFTVVVIFIQVYICLKNKTKKVYLGLDLLL